jgi:hypothetical protein
MNEKIKLLSQIKEQYKVNGEEDKARIIEQAINDIVNIEGIKSMLCD